MSVKKREIKEPGTMLRAAAWRRQGYINGARETALKIQEFLHEREDKAACSVSIYAVDEVVGEILRWLEDEDNG